MSLENLRDTLSDVDRQIIELVARWFGEIKDIGPGYLPRTFEI